MFRVKILLYEKEDRFLEIESEIPVRLRIFGVLAEYVEKSLKDFDFDPKKIKAYASGLSADAWISIAGSAEINLALKELNVPVFALYGCFPEGIAGIGPSHCEAFKKGLEQMIQYGHQRIVMYARKELRRPKPALMEQYFLDRLNTLGINADESSLPEWEESLKGFRESLAKGRTHKPPTAYIFQEKQLFVAAQQYFRNCGLRIPGDISLFCTDYDPIFEWSDPPATHSRWDQNKVLRRITEWAATVASGKEDTLSEAFNAEYVEGGTIGPAPHDHRAAG